jgi:hypothetical protein
VAKERKCVHSVLKGEKKEKKQKAKGRKKTLAEKKREID